MSEATLKPEYVKRAIAALCPAYDPETVERMAGLSIVSDFEAYTPQFNSSIVNVATAFQSDAESHASELERVRSRLSEVERERDAYKRALQEFADLEGEGVIWGQIVASHAQRALTPTLTGDKQDGN